MKKLEPHRSPKDSSTSAAGSARSMSSCIIDTENTPHFSMLDCITPMILTFNENENIKRTIQKLQWAKRILVIDSGSTDGTLESLANYPSVEVVRRPFDSFANQCNFGLSQLQTIWALSLDADYELSDELIRELRDLEEMNEVAGYSVSFIYRIYGHSLHGTLYPSRTILHRVRDAHYVDEGHGHRVRVIGKVRRLGGVIYHDDRKPLSRWLTSQQRYAHIEAKHLLSAGREGLSRSDRIRRMGWPMPILTLFYVLFVKGCLLDGWPGWFYALQRLLAETIVAIELIDHRLRSRLLGTRNE